MRPVYFRTDKIRKILSEISDASDFSLAIEDLWDPQNYPDGKVVDECGRTKEEAKKEGTVFWPDQNAIVSSLVPPRLMLAGDHGIYLTSNAIGRSVIVYAEGADPKKDEDCHNNKAAWFGYDDGVIPLPVQWAHTAVHSGSSYLTLGLSEGKISLISPKSLLNPG